MESISEEQKLG
jgi:AMME syndrome candidate gene 1 protein